MKIYAALLAILIGSAVFAAETPRPSVPAPDSDLAASMDDEALKSRFVFGPDRWAQFHALVQAGVQTSNTWDTSLKTNGQPKETKKNAYWSKDAYLRACRISFNGQIASNAFFFLQTDDLSAGKSSSTGDNSNTTNGKTTPFTQDAYVRIVPHKFFQIYSGLLTIPRDRINMQSQASLLTANGQSLVSSSMNGYSNNGRDTGIMLRGFAPSNKPIFEYRLGAFRGLGRQLDADGNVTRNKQSQPRIAGRIQLTAGDTEENYFLSENYLGKKALLSWGVGADFQQNQRDNKKNYFSYASDVTFETPSYSDVPMVINAQAGIIKAMNLPDTVGLPYKGYLIIYAQTGVLLAQKVQPTLKFTHRNNTGENKYRTLSAGLNYYLNGHFSNIKFDYDYPLSDNKKFPGEQKATLQFQGYL